MERNPPNMNLIYKDLFDVNHDYNMKINLTIINKESDFFVFLFLGDGVTIFRTPFLNILMSGKNLPVSVL